MNNLWKWLGSFSFAAFALAASASAGGFDVKESACSLGYSCRADQVHWNIAGRFDCPDVLSELCWDELRSNQLSFAICLTTCNHFYSRGNVDYGRIFHGKNSDSDYAENGRQAEYSRSIANAGKGELFDISEGIGYRFSWLNQRIHLAPLVGWSWHEQHLRMYDGFFIIPDISEIENLHSSYKMRWWGPWIGIDFLSRLDRGLSLFASVEYHFALYRAKGHWNLREDFLSDFKHKANSQGWEIKTGIGYSICGNWLLTLDFSYSDWTAEKGIHRVLVMNEEFEAVKLQSRLNEVQWRSAKATLSIARAF